MTKTSPSGQLDRLVSEIDSKRFIPARGLAQGDVQTIGAYVWQGRFRARDRTGDEERLFTVEAGSQVLARCRWQARRTDHATLVLWHGIESSTSAAYMLSTAAKAFHAGLNVVRVNYRNCGDTEHLTPTLYHGGLSADVRAVIEELINRDRLPRIFIAGFSLGGNHVLKLAGEYGGDSPAELAGVVAVSPSVNLRATSDCLLTHRNWIYHASFLYSLKRRLRKKAKLFPDRYDVSRLHQIRSLREYDNAFVAPSFGFDGADDYYAKASSLPYIGRIQVPTMIIHAQDDPFVPLAPLQDQSVVTNPNVLLLTPERGGHVAFLSANGSSEDRFWAENRLIDFCRVLISNTD